MKKPSVTDTLDFRAAMRVVWNTAHGNWKTLDEPLYDDTFEMRVVKPAKARRLATGSGIIDGMGDTLVSAEPDVTRKTGNKDKDDKTEIWGRALLMQMAQEQIVPPFKVSAKFLSMLGYSNMGLKWNQVAFDEGRFPFYLEVPHPARILMPPFHRQPSVAIESATVPVWEVAGKYPSARVGKKDFEQVLMIIHTSKDWISVLLDDKQVSIKPNVYEEVFYTHAFAGYGYEKSPSYDGPNLGPKPEDFAVGLLRKVEDGIISIAEFHSAMLALALRTAYRSIFTEGDPEELARNFNAAGLGGVIPKEKGVKIEWEEPPRVDPWMFQIPQTYQQAVVQGTYATEVRGFKSPGVETATQHALMLGSSRQKFDIPMKELNYMAGKVLGFAAKMVATQDISVTIGGVTCGKGDFEDNFDFTVDFSAKDEGQILRAKESGMREVGAGLSSLERYLEEAAQVSDVTGEMKRIMVNRFKQSPTIMEAVIGGALQIHSKRLAKEGIVLPPMGGQQGGAPTAGPLVQPQTPNESRRVMGDMTEQVPVERAY